MIYIDIYSTQAVIRSQEPLTVGLVGGQAHFRFSDRWKNLTKTVVFRQGNITVDAVGVTSGAVIPWEVLKTPGMPVSIGVYGSDDTGKIIMPTVWVKTNPVLEGADPMVDASTDPSLPVYQQIQTQVEKNTPLVVEISGNTQTGYQAEPGLPDIRDAWKLGRPIYAQQNDRRLPLVLIDDNIAQFSCADGGIIHSVHVMEAEVRSQYLHTADLDTVEAQGAAIAALTEQDIAHNTKLLEHDGFLQELDEEGRARGNAISQLQETNRDLQDRIQTLDENLEKEVSDREKTAKQHTIQLNAQQNTIDGHTDRLNKLESGGVAGGGSGVHVGTEPPVDETVSLWVNQEGGAESEDAAYYDQTVTLEEARNDYTLNFPCPIADFHELHIHMTGMNGVSQLYMEAGGESTYVIAPQHAATSGTHIHLMATHQRNIMNMDATTAAYSEHAQPGVPLGVARIGNEAASLRLYSKDGGDDIYAGTEIRVWGVYKAKGVGTFKIKNPETGEWESLKTLRGENGKDGADGKDYVITDADKQDIAQEAAGLVDVPEYELPVANPDILGGVKPVEKTDKMTSPVGVDAQGGLWSAGGSGENWRLAKTVVIDTDGVTDILITEDDDGKPLNCQECYWTWDNPTATQRSNAYTEVHDENGNVVGAINAVIGAKDTRTCGVWYVRRMGLNVYIEAVVGDLPHITKYIYRNCTTFPLNSIKKISFRTDGLPAIANGATLRLYVRE